MSENIKPTGMNQQLYLPKDVVYRLPAMVRHSLAKMPPERQAEFLEVYQKRARKLWVAYLLWVCFGWHYAYLGQWGTQVLFWISWFTLFIGPIWWFVDAFRLPGMVGSYNEEVAISVMRDLAAIAN